MTTVGIICEYNPLHLGHQYQMQEIRRQYGGDSCIVCLMSGNFVQRGHPAIFHKQIRAEAAIRAGADLVVELPIPVCLSSAEGYAAGAVAIANQLCDVLSFGTESLSPKQLFAIAEILDSPGFSGALKEALSTGISFPAARQKALEAISESCPAPTQPNDILGAEYCKAILRSGSSLSVFAVPRSGCYHARELDEAFPSATAVRRSILQGGPWHQAVPEQAQPLFHSAPVHTRSYGERAILCRLRTMTETDFSELPYGSEGLWRRFMHACRSSANLDEILAATKTKRYTRTRIDRMVMCAHLGITQAMLHSPAPYVRVLAFTPRGRTLLNRKKQNIPLRNVGEKADDPFWDFECRCSNLYDLFSRQLTAPGQEQRCRIYYERSGSQ